MKLKLLDYNAQSFEYDIGELSDIIRIDLEIISGDEVVTISYKDGTTKILDTSPDRFIDYDDGYYVVYDEATDINLLENKKWLNRKTSYEY